MSCDKSRFDPDFALLVNFALLSISISKESFTMSFKATGHYITTVIAGESVQAFVPDPLPPKLTAEQLAELEGPIQDAEAAIDRLRLAGDMIPSLHWFSGLTSMWCLKTRIWLFQEEKKSLL